MKKLVYLLILISGICNAQIVNIPDANFKAKLLESDPTNTIAYAFGNGGYIKIDANDDGEIQLSEVSIITTLKITDSQVSDLTGIENFINLKTLSCFNNTINNFNVNGLSSLSSIMVNSNDSLNTIFNFSNLPSLTSFSFNYSNITSLTINNLPNITGVSCFNNNNMTDLNLIQLSSLNRIDADECNVSNLSITNSPLITYLSIQNSNLSSIIINSFPLLKTLRISGNLIIDTSGFLNLNNLEELNIQGNQITNLILPSLPSLKYLYCGTNNISTINLTALTNLKGLILGFNNLTILDVSNNILLESLICNSNQLTELNFSQNINLVYLACSNNLLTNINIKNGSNETVSLDGNPNLEFICADELQIPNILQQYPNLNGHISSYCSFTPGGNYNTITGNLKYDINNNGCDVNDVVQPNIRMNITEPNASGASFTNISGNYAFYTQAGTFTLTPDVENPTWFNFLPNTADIVFADNNNNVATQDFCVAANGFHPDIEVVISPISPARPGFDAVYQITYKNKGNYTYIDGFVNLEYDDTVLDFVSTSQSPNSEGLGSIGWIFSNLLPFESRSIQVTFNVNAPTEIPALNIGDVLTFRVYSYPSEVDETPLDNDFTYNQTVVGSYDPNDITCLEGNSLPPSEIGNYLHYAINFENTGNYPAENIVVKTEVDATKFDINSLQLLTTSNPVDARITGNKVEFIFQNIQLPIGGHGHILLKVKSKATLVLGDSVAKRADIFFDYNAPIDTGFANTTFQTLSNTIFETDTTINVYPNPTISKITINSDFDLKSIQVYDVQGRILETLIGKNKNLDISDKANGVYFLKITTNKGSKIEKLIKK